MGAWIETSPRWRIRLWLSSRTPCGCVDWNFGLTLTLYPAHTSHPMWVRGLKPIIMNVSGTKSMSHPMWVRGLKHNISKQDGIVEASHPMWVRGLKLFQVVPIILCHSRTPCGCVDWNRWWSLVQGPPRLSHPMWVRGLKQLLNTACILKYSRTPCGCVDWNQT